MSTSSKQTTILRRKKKVASILTQWKIRCKGKRLTEKRGSLKQVPLLKLKAQLMSPPPTIKNTKKKNNKFPHVWSRLSLKGLKVLKTRLLSNRKRILVLEKKNLLGTQKGVKNENPIIAKCPRPENWVVFICRIFRT